MEISSFLAKLSKNIVCKLRFVKVYYPKGFSMYFEQI